MLSYPKNRIISLFVLFPLAAILLGGCTTGAVNYTELRQMPTDVAWQTMKQKARASGIIDSLAKNALTAAYKDALNEEIQNADSAAQQAGTPREALEMMVTDVTSLLMESLPADARNRRLDQYRLNVAMGDLVNKEEDPALRGAMGLIKRNLERDRDFNDLFGFLALNQSDANVMLEQLAGDDTGVLFDPTGRSGGGTSSGYGRDRVYLVSGESWIQRNDNTHELTVWTDISAIHVMSRRSAGGDTFSRTYYYHPGYSKFISEEKNEELRDQWESRSSN